MTSAEHFKAWLTATKRTYRDVAQSVGRSPSHIGEVARGNYPWNGAGDVPRHIWRWAISYGMPEPAP